MIKIALFIIVFFTSFSMNAQDFIKKIPLKEGKADNIKYNDLNLNMLFQTYDENSDDHLKGDIYLKVQNEEEIVAEFYVDYDSTRKEYYTQIYQNYFFTIDKENKLLIVEKAHFGKVFALLNNRNALVGKMKDSIEIEITDFMMESGYDAPPEDSNRSYFNNVHYNLKVKSGDVKKDFSFYSSEITDNFTFEIDGYNIRIISDRYKDSSCLIEMVVNKK